MLLLLLASCGNAGNLAQGEGGESGRGGKGEFLVRESGRQNDGRSWMDPGISDVC